MLWKSWNAAFVLVALLVGGSLLAAIRFWLFPHQPMTWVIALPRAYAARRWASMAWRTARSALTKVRAFGRVHLASI